jgi:hypothetical protein
MGKFGPKMAFKKKNLASPWNFRPPKNFFTPGPPLKIFGRGSCMDSSKFALFFFSIVRSFWLYFYIFLAFTFLLWSIFKVYLCHCLFLPKYKSVNFLFLKPEMYFKRFGWLVIGLGSRNIEPICSFYLFSFFLSFFLFLSLSFFLSFSLSFFRLLCFLFICHSFLPVLLSFSSVFASIHKFQLIHKCCYLTKTVSSVFTVILLNFDLDSSRKLVKGK